ncbi:arginyl-tRNA--protein transferase 2 isoform X2 [Sorghum bicolor]|uniref:arginyl-tRNA--protein transferase 2 isoform X2 n=1 Tax=Sorghum bicolor TaxID=4558 RepID=UPI000B423B44|nr:arginyl-tRNA--protein transferase 2 isoform X2 [Sorghum bicolor]|eukprot:XP_021303425.1 arginyl-tRNA--protein transferase 2 isoform X2 [Sorghum bicolor]
MADGASSSGGAQNGGESVVIDYGRRRTTCGYCRSSGPTSISHGMWANSLKADDYQALLDRGWRRSGCFLYKPEMERTCCPSYTIRLKANDFICSKEQGRVLKKMQRFLDGDLDPHIGSPQCKASPTKRSLGEPLNSPTSKVSKVSAKEFRAGMGPNISKEDDVTCCLASKINEAADTCFQGGVFGSVQLPKAIVKTVKPQVKRKVGESVQEKKVGEAVQDLVYTCNISFQIVAAVRRALPKENGANQNEVLADLSPNSVAEKLSMAMERLGQLAGFEVKACNGHLNFYLATNQAMQNHTSFVVPVQTSDKSSGSKQSSVNKTNTKYPLKRKILEIRLSTSHFDPEEFALYRRYQTKVHKEKTVTESSYKRFLVDTPIVFVPPKSGDNSVPPCGFGSFHQQYRIDGKLVAVGVVDILPKCLSSKYLFWDPDLSFLSLGKYTALKEIDWVKTTHEHCPSLQYYYLGYYIHSCNKMRYKAAYRPSELLCPVRYEWVPYDLAKPLLDTSQYSILSDYATMQGEVPQPQICGPSDDSSAKIDHHDSTSDEDDDEDFNDYESDMMVDEETIHSEKPDTTEGSSNINDIKNITLDLNGSRVKFKQVFGPIERRHLTALEGQLSRYVKVVGKELSDRIVYCLS